MDSNNGLGAMIEKNHVVLEDTFPSGYLQAIQHANGRDWWVIAPKAISNCYHKLLLDSAGLHYVEKQSIGRECIQFPLGVGTKEASFGVSEWPDGVYFYEVRTSTGQVGAGKLVIRN